MFATLLETWLTTANPSGTSPADSTPSSGTTNDGNVNVHTGPSVVSLPLRCSTWYPARSSPAGAMISKKSFVSVPSPLHCTSLNIGHRLVDDPITGNIKELVAEKFVWTPSGPSQV